MIFPFTSLAQVDSLNQVGEDPGFILEDILSNIESEVDFDFNTLFEELEGFRKRPINLNKADAEELGALRLLTNAQIDRLLSYRSENGPLIAIYELQAIPGFDVNTIRLILPFVRVGGDLDDFQVSLWDMFSGGSNEVFLRWQRFLETQKGFTPPTETSTNRFEGDPNRYYLRYRHFYENRLSYGITAEKDIGESFFGGSNPQGFDFYSAHIFLRNYKDWLKAVALGDFSVSFGQGLILQLGFANGKSAFTTDVARLNRTLNPYTSVNEASFYRGGGVTFNFFDHLDVTAFGSIRQLDGNVIQEENEEIDDPLEVNLSSLYNSGLHRTPSEIEDEGAVQNISTGGSVKYKTDRWHIAANVVYDQLDITLSPRPQVYNQFFFSGDRLLNASLDYSLRLSNFRFFGETARSSNNAYATLNGVLIGLDRNVDLSIVQRSFARDFQTLRGNPLAETAGVRNEQGLYFGTEIRFNKKWRLNAYMDLFKHPWLRFNIDAPTTGYEWLGRLTFYLKRKMEVYAQVRNEVKYRNAVNNDTKIDYTLPTQRLSTRFQFSYKLNKALELRSRLSVNLYNNGIQESPDLGYLLYQDFIYKPLGPLSFTARYSIFRTDSFNARLYAFENDLLYTFSIPAYFNTGTRYYLNLRYKGIRNLTLEARVAQTYFQDGNILSGKDEVTTTIPNIIGSGLNEIEGNTRTELKFQVKFKF